MLRKILTILGGSVFAQGIALLSLPVISRVYAPSEFGDFQVFASTITLFLPFAALKMEYAFLRVRAPEVLPNLLMLCLVLTLSISAFLYIFAQLLVAVYMPSSAGELWASGLLPASFFAAGLIQMLSYIPIRYERFGLTSLSKVAQSGVFHAGSAFSGWASVSPSGHLLVWWDVFSRVLASAIIALDYMRLRSRYSWRISIRRMLALLSAYRRYPLYSLPGSFIGALVAALPIFWLSSSFGDDSAGQFGMAWRSTVLPASMLIQAIAQVTSAEISKMVRVPNGNLRKHLFRVSRNTTLLGIGPVIIVSIFGEAIITLVLGAEWREAGRMVEAMAPLLLGSILSGPINMALVIMGRPIFQFGWELARVLVVFLGFWVSNTAGISAVDTVGLFSVVMLLMALVFVGVSIVLAETNSSARN